MSNDLAIATVTAAVGQIVHAAAKSAVTGITLRFGRPPVPEANLRCANIYLYQALPYGPMRNNDQPIRDCSGRLTNRPRAALELHYLFSFYGDEASLEPDRMLGAVWRDLHENPVLSRQAIEDAVSANSQLTKSDLALASERVKLTPLPLSLEDLSRLWSVMVQRPHALSMPWQAAVVLIDGIGDVAPSLPVLRRGPGDRGPVATASRFPRLIEAWFGLAGTVDLQPRPPTLRAAQLGCDLILEGERLEGDAVSVEFRPRGLGPVQIPLAEAGRTSTRLKLTLPDDQGAQDAWAAGVLPVRVITKRGDTELRSASLPISLAPRIASFAPNPVPAGNATLTVECRPKALPELARLRIGQREISANDGPGPTDTLEFSFNTSILEDGDLAVLIIDGVESQPVKFDSNLGVFVFDDAQRLQLA